MIEIKNVVKTYGKDELEVHALQSVNLQIKEGEFTAIVGPSGSGKTSLLNCIGGLDDPNAGSIQINGIEITGLNETDRTKFRLHQLGFVFQSYNLIPVLTAFENVEFIMLLQAKDQAYRKERAENLLKAVGLGKEMHKRPSEMSGGQQQRVAVARALASKPMVVLADEPTANLDSHSTETLLDIMLNMNKEEGMTFVFSTHDQRVIDRARRVITIEDGKVVSDKLN